MQREKKKWLWQNYDNGDCKKFLGQSVVDWGFYESTCNLIHSTRIHRSMWARLHNIHMRASTYSKHMSPRAHALLSKALL